MAKYRPWLVCCSVFACGFGTVAVVCLCVFSLLDKACTSGSFRRAAVSADSRLCSEIGRNMLQQGGSAVDGAIAALLCTSVVNPQSMGLGGGSIVTVRETNGKVKVYNFRETVPKTNKKNLLADCPTTFSLSSGSQWIGVPGELRGYEVLHKKYGRLPWDKLFAPTVRLARDGMPMPAYLGHFLSSPLVKHRVENSSLCEVLCNKNRTVLQKGDILKFTQLAETMETIGKLGAEAFYSGKIGKVLIEDVKAAGGTLTLDDLMEYKVRVEEAQTVSLGDSLMHIPPPPSGGALLAFILQLMRGFALSPKSWNGDEKIHMYHRYIEAAKFANGQRRNICDPRFCKDKSAAHLTDSSFTNHIREMISLNQTHDSSYYFSVKPPSDNTGTTHVSVLDENGLAVSATSTINQLFGGTIYSPRTGIILNNELSDFCGRAASIQPGEQPPSSMAPVILESKSGDLLVIGGSGGSMITTAVALSIMNRLWIKMSLKDAIAAPIVFVDSNNNVNFEPGFDESVTVALRALGQRVGNWKYFLNVVNAVERESGCISAFSDARKMGESAGY